MRKLIRAVTAMAVLSMFTLSFTLSGFAQGKGRDKRPIKTPETVRTEPKRRDPPPPPPQNTNRPKQGDKKKP